MLRVSGRRGFQQLSGKRFVSTIAPYLHETVIPTYHFQDSLPKLPVPKLDDSLKKYLYFSQPMVSPEEHAKTAEIVAAFESNEGQSLQEELVALDKKAYTSFYNQMWFDMYLESRTPLPLNYNPQMTFNDEKIASKNEQAVRTANLVASSLRFYKTLVDEKLIPDIFHTQPEKSRTTTYETVCRLLPRQFSFYGSYFFGAYPLDMSQYKNLFSSTRIPKKAKDELRKFSPQQSKHIVVQRGNAIYTVQVLTDDMGIIDHASIERAIRSILSDTAGQAACKDSVGVLTSMDRDAWAEARAKLETNAMNKKALEAIDSALFAICLDEAKPESYQEISSCMLHGNARNRWFDKSFQLIVAGNGKTAVNFEHAWGDGVAVLRYFNEVYTDSTKLPAREPVTSDIPAVVNGTDATAPVGVPKLLSFDLDSGLKATIDKAGKDVDGVIAGLQLGTFESNLFGKDSLKKLKVNGDAFMQMGFQLAHERMKGYTPSTYESASTAAFKHGRTETIRSATPEAAKFAKAFCDSSMSKEERAGLLRAAAKRHSEITKDALMGKGMDRHLFALRVLASRRDPTKMPAIFTDKSYQVLSNIILSTSTLSSEALYAGGFGPVGPDCFALAYGIADDGARTAVATYGLGSQEFADHLDQAFKDMLKALE